MIRLVTLVLLMLAGPALACPAPSKALLFHSCWGTAQAELSLLPEDGLPTPSGSLSLTVTGGYTGRDTRGADLPNPVGLFLRGGQVVNRQLVPMDGVLVIDREGGLRLFHRARVVLGAGRYNLDDAAQRQAFVAAARAAGLSVLQSHLLIVDGLVDVAATRDAPEFQRRMLFTDRDGYGVYETPGVETLEAAAQQIEAALRPVMVLNLDMGSYDFCQVTRPEGTTPCGFVAPGDTAKLSNLLTFRLGAP